LISLKQKLINSIKYANNENKKIDKERKEKFI